MTTLEDTLEYAAANPHDRVAQLVAADRLVEERGMNRMSALRMLVCERIEQTWDADFTVLETILCHNTDDNMRALAWVAHRAGTVETDAVWVNVICGPRRPWRTTAFINGPLESTTAVAVNCGATWLLRAILALKVVTTKGQGVIHGLVWNCDPKSIRLSYLLH